MPQKFTVEGFEIDPNVSRLWKGIVWHHSASPDSITRDWDGIVKYHTSYRIDHSIVSKQDYERRLKFGDGKVFELPWKDVAYNGGTEWESGKFVFQLGRSLLIAGAHSGLKGYPNTFNEEYLGFCAVGNFDLAPPADLHWELNLKITRAFMTAFGIEKENVIGHREVYDRLGVPRQKSCPGKSWDMDKFRKDL